MAEERVVRMGESLDSGIRSGPSRSRKDKPDAHSCVVAGTAEEYLRWVRGHWGVEFWPGDPTNYIRDLASHYQDPNLLARIKSHIDAAVAQLPVDRSRVILAGFSGGAFIAHDLNAAYPGFAAAVIDNSNGEPVLAPMDLPEEQPFVPTDGAFAASRRVAIFLVGEDDSTFLSQVRQTIPIYQQRWGWQTLLLTYPGGHKPAPAHVLNRAIAWLLSRPTWV